MFELIRQCWGVDAEEYQRLVDAEVDVSLSFPYLPFPYLPFP